MAYSLGNLDAERVPSIGTTAVEVTNCERFSSDAG